MFNIFLIDLILIIDDFDFASYTDDYTTYVSANSMYGVDKLLEEASTKLFKWLIDNLMKSNAGKCYFHESYLRLM